MTCPSKSDRNATARRYRRRLALWVALPLALNALLYLGYRDWSLWCFRWVEWTGGEGIIGQLRSTARALPTPPEWVRFSLASGLWIFGVVSFLMMTWRRSPSAPLRPLTLWVGGLLTVCVGSEAFQALTWIPGTADWSDVLAYLIGTSLAISLAALRPIEVKCDADFAGRRTLSAPLASVVLVAFALALATGAIYEGAMAELVAQVSPYK